jgi:hypothetical protein
MSTTAGQNLSLGKLKRAVSSSINVNNTTDSSLGSVSSNAANTKMSEFSIDSIDSISGFQYLFEQTTENYEVEFTNSGSRFFDTIGANTANFTWTKDGNLGVTFGSADYLVAVTAPSITNTDGAIAGSFNQSGSIIVKFAEDGQSDGYNDHATNYNTNNVSKSIEVVDTYGGVPSCLLFGSMVSKSDGTTTKVEDLNIGDEILTVQLPNATDESEGNWKNDSFNQTGSFTQHSASVHRVLYEFSQHYYDINNGQELITGEHHMLYRQSGSDSWTWKTAPNFEVGNYLMDKQGNEVEITSLNINQNPDGYEVVQLDVEPDDYYVGSTFVVHNKGSNSEPSYPTTQWQNADGDFNLHLLDGDTGISGENVVSLLKTIQLSNGSGNSSFSCQQPSNGNIELKVSVSTSGDPGTNGTGNSATGFGNTQSSVAAASTYYMRFQLIETKANPGDLSAEDRTITITNNGVSNTDIDINCRFEST